MEMQGAGIDAEILRVIGQNPYTVHNGSEAEYSYLGSVGVCIEILNENEELNLYIDIDHDEYTVSFDVFHMHLPTGDSQAMLELLDVIDGILHNRICAVSIWCPDGKGEMVCKVSTSASADEAANSSWVELFGIFGSDKRHLPFGIAETGGEEQVRFWNASMCKNIPIPKTNLGCKKKGLLRVLLGKGIERNLTKIKKKWLSRQP
ncbi:MAG: hypothetical protein II875_05100 [Clostridia bacterium]|nr:hypothetical protein [Clostridia bacterium]